MATELRPAGAGAAAAGAPLPCSYLVPVRWGDGAARAGMAAYLAAVAPVCAETIVIDGSPPDVFAANHEAFAPHVSAHLPPDADLRCRNGKVAGVLSAARRAGQEALVIADDDVRYDRAGLERLLALLAAIFPANVHMAVSPEQIEGLDLRKVPRWLLWARLPVQPLLMVWVWRATR